MPHGLPTRVRRLPNKPLDTVWIHLLPSRVMEKNLTEQMSFRVSPPVSKRLSDLAEALQRRRADMIRILFLRGLEAVEREQKGRK